MDPSPSEVVFKAVWFVVKLVFLTVLEGVLLNIVEV
jgi:hypothetical protein